MFFGSGRGVKGKVSLQESCLRQPFWLMPGIHQNVAIEERKKRKCDDSQGLQEGHNLSKKLLHLWSLGKLSATGLQELAQASVSDGLQSQDIMELCGLGSFGAYPNNCHRDLLRLLKNKLKNSRHGGLKESPTFSIQVPALASKEENPSTMATCHMVLPHLFVWQLFQSYPQLAPSLFGVQKLKAFWSGLKPDDPRLWGWGLKESQKAKTIPLWLHGDGVEFSTDTLLTFSWGPSLFTPQGLKESQEQNASHSMDSSFLVTAWPKSATDSKTWDAIHAVRHGALQPCSMASIQKLIGKETHCHPIWQGLQKSHLQSKAIHFGFSISSVTWNIMQTTLIFRIGAHTNFVGFATATKQIPTRTHMISLTTLDGSLQVLKA